MSEKFNTSLKFSNYFHFFKFHNVNLLIINQCFSNDVDELLWTLTWIVIEFYGIMRWFKYMHVSGYEQWRFLSCTSLSRWCKSMINDWSIKCPGLESRWLIQTILVFYFLFFVFKTWSTQNYRELSGNVFYCFIFYNVYVSVLTNRAKIDKTRQAVENFKQDMSVPDNIRTP